MKKLKNIFLIMVISFSLLAVFTGAGCTMKDLIGKDPKMLTKEDFESGVSRFIDIMAAAASTITIIFIIIGGIQYLTSLGNEQKISQAKSTLTWAVVGFIVIIASWVIVKFIAGWFGG